MQFLAYVVPFIFGVLFLRLAFSFFKKGEQASGKMFSLIGAFFISVSFHWFEAEQIFCILAGSVLFWLAYQYVKKDSMGQAFVFSLIAAGLFFCSLSGVQSLIKTGVRLRIADSLREYGNKIDKFQTDLVEMHDDLSSNQMVLKNTVTNTFAKQESELRNYQSKLEMLHAAVLAAQSNIISQERTITNQYQNILSLQETIKTNQMLLESQTAKLASVEGVVTSLYSRVKYETIIATDSSHVLIFPLTNGCIAFVLRLENVPVEGSIKLYTLAGGNNRMPQTYLEKIQPFVNNFIFKTLYGYNTNTLSFQVEYVADFNQSNAHKLMMPKELLQIGEGGTNITYPINAVF